MWWLNSYTPCTADPYTPVCLGYEPITPRFQSHLNHVMQLLVRNAPAMPIHVHLSQTCVGYEPITHPQKLTMYRYRQCVPTQLSNLTTHTCTTLSPDIPQLGTELLNALHRRIVFLVHAAHTHTCMICMASYESENMIHRYYTNAIEHPEFPPYVSVNHLRHVGSVHRAVSISLCICSLSAYTYI